MSELDLRHSAIVNVHWQYEVVSPDGVFGSFFAEQIRRHGVIPKAAEIIDAMRSAHKMVIYTRVAYRPGYPDLIVNTPTFALVKEKNAYLEGSPKAEIIEQLAPHPRDIVITQIRLGGFIGTELDLILRNNGIDTLLFTGVATNIAVEGTAREAIDHGYRIVIVSDACTAATDAAHQASLETMGLLGQVVTVDEVVHALRRRGKEPC